jgi:hypothetical protein
MTFDKIDTSKQGKWGLGGRAPQSQGVFKIFLNAFLR